MDPLNPSPRRTAHSRSGFGVSPSLLFFLMAGLCVAMGATILGATFALAEVSGNLIVAGNGPEQTTIEGLARAFEKANPRAYVDVVWDDHSKPVEMVKGGDAHLAVTGAEDAGLTATQIAW